MQIETACEAMTAHKCLELTYEGERRLVEVHTAGAKNDGEPAISVWQTHNFSQPHAKPNWRLFTLNEVSNVSISSEVSHAPRQGFKRDDKRFQSIRCQASSFPNF
jgi:hypothetical protein